MWLFPCLSFLLLFCIWFSQFCFLLIFLCFILHLHDFFLRGLFLPHVLYSGILIYWPNIYFMSLRLFFDSESPLVFWFRVPTCFFFFFFCCYCLYFFTVIAVSISLILLFGLLLSSFRATLPPGFDPKLPLSFEAHSNGIWNSDFLSLILQAPE